MTVTSKYVPADLCPEIGEVHWFACWCSECNRIWLMGAMQERVSCPYCTVIIEPSTILWGQGGNDVQST